MKRVLALTLALMMMCISCARAQCTAVSWWGMMYQRSVDITCSDTQTEETVYVFELLDLFRWLQSLFACDT